MESKIAQLIQKAIKQAYKLDVTPQIEPVEARFGDFSTNIAFQLAGRLKKAPNALATELAAKLSDPSIAKAEAAGAGFINITLSPDVWIKQLHEISAHFGASKLGRGQKVQVEFISANPTGPLTLGNARGGFTGDVLANVLAHAGYSVTREYYFNDAGTQISKLVQSIRAEAGEKIEGERQYSGSYIKELARDLEPYLEKGNDEVAAMATQMIFERFIQDAIEKMNIRFDEWFNEKHLVASGQFDKALERLKKEGLVYDKDGATWLASSKYGDERDRVLVKSTGDITYLGTDIPYHLNIFVERKFDRAIKVWGADHAGQVPSLKLTINKLLPDKQLDFLILQWVRLIHDGKEVKMSKRAGTYVTVEELVDEVGADVARFFFLMRSSDTQLDFDLDLAKEQSQKNPLWYVMYAYARAHSIMRQATDKGFKPGTKTTRLSSKEQLVVKQLSLFPKLIEEIAGNYGIHQLAFFGYEVARLFHDWYEDEKILSLPDKEVQEKLFFLQQFIQFMNVYFKLLGIKPTEKM